MPWIGNYSLSDFETGQVRKIDRKLVTDEEAAKTVAIQLVDQDMEFPSTPIPFCEVYQFKFLDVDEPGPVTDKYGIQQEQADAIFQILQKSLDAGKNVVVHCVMGVCRSGAVASVGVQMGFEDAGTWRAPNSLVQRMMRKNLGWWYAN